MRAGRDSKPHNGQPGSWRRLFLYRGEAALSFTDAVSARRRGRSNTTQQPRTSSAALHKSGFGTKRTYRDDLLIVRFWSRADIARVRCLLRPTRMTQSGHERAAFAAMHATGLLLFIDTGCKRPHELAMDSSHHARRIRARARRLSAGAWDMRMHLANLLSDHEGPCRQRRGPRAFGPPSVATQRRRTTCSNRTSRPLRASPKTHSRP